MERIRLEDVNRLRALANEVYELGQQPPTERFDASVAELIRCLDVTSVCQKTPAFARNLRRTTTHSARFGPRNPPHRHH